MKRDSRDSRAWREANEGRVNTGAMLGLVGVTTALIVAVVIFAVTRGSDDAERQTAVDTCGVVDSSRLQQASLALALDGGTGSCDDFGSSVSVPDVGQRMALRITYVNESDAAQNVTLRLDLPSAVAPEVTTAKIYNTTFAGETLATGNLLWSEDGLKLGTYDPDESAVVIAYAAVEGDFDAAGCEELRDPVTAYASSRGETTVSAELKVQVGAGC
jgi:hypothetical protein